MFCYLISNAVKGFLHLISTTYDRVYGKKKRGGVSWECSGGKENLREGDEAGGFEKVMLNVVSGYGPQGGCKREEDWFSRELDEIIQSGQTPTNMWEGGGGGQRWWRSGTLPKEWKCHSQSRFMFVLIHSSYLSRVVHSSALSPFCCYLSAWGFFGHVYIIRCLRVCSDWTHLVHLQGTSVSFPW